jgi:hypothetical protein
MKPNTSKLMQSLLRTSGVCGAVVAVGTVGMIALPGDAQAQISNTKHNLTTGGGQAKRSSGTEICAFCHTPHASNTSATGAPLWNKAVPAASTFSVYTSTSLDAGTGSLQAASLACLSCHDGAQAMDNMVNAPGAGNYTASGASAGYTWTGGSGMGTGVTNIGKDLRNDHPIGIAYAGGGYAAGTASANDGTGTAKTTCVACTDKDFWEPTRISSTAWYVNANGTAGKQKTDIQLYPSGGAVMVECGSCHDPHVQTKVAGEIAFLRVSNAGSALCLACHNK